MGTMHHHAIVVTSFDHKSLRKAHNFAKLTFPWVSPISPTVTNNYRSFFIPPDGSKEGWKLSNRGNQKRLRFLEYMHKLNLDEDRWVLTWVEVGFENGNARIASYG